jgi:hypothetical protein
MTRTLARRLERLEERFTPTSAFPDITVEFVWRKRKG